MKKLKEGFKKRLITTSGLVILPLTLVGCGRGDAFTIWLDNDTYGDVMVEALSERFPETKFVFENVGAVDSMEKLSLDGPAGNGGEIMLLPSDHLADAVSRNLLLPLGSGFNGQMQGRIMDAALETVQVGGDYFGVPIATESIALFYNEDLLAELGFTPATTFEELIRQAESFNNPANNEFLLRWEAGNPYSSQFFLTAFGYELFGPTHDNGDLINLDTPEVVAGLEFYKTIRDILPVPIADLDWANTHGAFVTGTVPYLISGPWSFDDLHNDADFAWGVSKIPTIKGVQPITFSGNIIAAISAYSEDVDLAREVLAFVTSDEGLQIMFEERGSIPALIDSSHIEGVGDVEQIQGILAQAEFSQAMPAIPEMDLFWGATPPMYEAVWEGLLTPAEASMRAQADFEAARDLARGN